jgi:hypothetical protein
VRLAALAVLALAPLLVLSACESSQETSARLKKTGAKAIKGQKGLKITQKAAGVQVAERVVLHDANGAAVALVLKNSGGTPLFKVPIAIDVLGRSGHSVFRNNLPGLDRSLTSLAVLPSRGSSVWVNDQVDAATTPAKVRAVVGAPKPTHAPASLPDIVLTGVRVQNDPASGLEAVGKARLKSGPAQDSLVVYCVGRRGGRIVAAGRSVIPRLTTRKAVAFHVFFIGDPKHTKLALSAPPTVL